MTLVVANGARLNLKERGSGPPLLLLHGFTGTALTWEPFLDGWSEFRCLAVDIIGHGLSDAPADVSRYSPDRVVDDLTVLLDELSVRSAAVLGYSMGGRLALNLALRAPPMVRAVILESTNPGIEDSNDREARIEKDEALARRITDEGIARFVDNWANQPVFSSQSSLPTPTRTKLREQRLGNDPRGLANCLRGLGLGRQGPLWSRLDSVSAPVLLLAGSLDRKYCELGQRMANAFPRAKLEIVPEAGHAVHLEQPESFSAIVSKFLREHLAS